MFCGIYTNQSIFIHQNYDNYSHYVVFYALDIILQMTYVCITIFLKFFKLNYFSRRLDTRILYLKSRQNHKHLEHVK